MAADHLLLAYIILVISGDGVIFGSTWVGFLIPLFSLNSSGHYPEKFFFLSAMYLGISPALGDLCTVPAFLKLFTQPFEKRNYVYI